MPDTQASPLPIELELQGSPAGHVLSVEGSEAVSRLPRYRLAWDLPPDTLPPELGARGRLTLHAGGFTRVLSVEVTEVHHEPAPPGRIQRVSLMLRHPAARLLGRKTRRIFQALRSVDIARALLTEHGIGLDDQTLESRHEREYCVQYDESDWAFLRRILAEEGIAFRWSTPEGASDVSKLVVIDHAERQLPASGPHFVVVAGDEDDALVRYEHHAFAFRESKENGPTGLVRRIYDLNRPATMAEERAAPAGASALSEVLEAHGLYGEAQIAPLLATRALEQRRRKTQRIWLRAASCRLVPGQVIALEAGGKTAPFVVTQVAIRGRQASEGPTLESEATLIEASRLARPARPKRRVVQALERATVVGPEHEEIFTDALGRVRVKFPWDRAEANDDTCSCWLRVSTAWAGAGFGTQFVPRVGMEALVGFLDGDPYQPVVLGCLPNRLTTPAFRYPEERTQSGIVTRSTPGGAGQNHLIFEDAQGLERVSLHGQRDISLTAKADSELAVGGDHSTMIAGNRSEHVVGAQTLVVEGGASSHCSGDSEDTILGDKSERIEGNLDRHIQGSTRGEVAGSLELAVQSAASLSVAGICSLRAEGLLQIEIGDDQAPGRGDVMVRGSLGLQADEGLSLHSSESITLIVGESRLVISPSEIRLESPRIALTASRELELRGAGPSLTLADETELLSKKVRIHSTKGRLVLDDEAQLIGQRVLLNCKPKDASKDSEGNETKTIELALRLTDETFSPYANKHYELTAEGLRMEGTTDADGGLREKLPEASKAASLRLWLEDYPEGKTKTYALTLGALSGADTVLGARMRLRNLGYFDGDVSLEQSDPAFERALSSFQADHDLPESKKLDPETIALLSERHGG